MTTEPSPIQAAYRAAAEIWQVPQADMDTRRRYQPLAFARQCGWTAISRIHGLSEHTIADMADRHPGSIVHALSVVEANTQRGVDAESFRRLMEVVGADR